MMKNTKDPLQLDQEEKDLLAAYEAGEFVSIFSEEEKKKLVGAALKTLKSKKTSLFKQERKTKLKV